jgi:hypothetical protein
MILTEKILDITTGEETIIEREETQAEEKARLKLQAEMNAERAEMEARATAKSALLERLGITSEEAALLLT